MDYRKTVVEVSEQGGITSVGEWTHAWTSLWSLSMKTVCFSNNEQVLSARGAMGEVWTQLMLIATHTFWGHGNTFRGHGATFWRNGANKWDHGAAPCAWLEHCKVPMILKILKSIFFIFLLPSWPSWNPSRCIKASFYVSEKKLDFPTTRGFRRKISMKLFQIMFTNSWQFSLIHHPVILPTFGCL